MGLRYAHLTPSHKVKAVEVLDDTLTGNPTIQELYMPIKKGLKISLQTLVIFGGADGDRTRDLLTASQTRSQLRYSPMLLLLFTLPSRPA